MIHLSQRRVMLRNTFNLLLFDTSYPIAYSIQKDIKIIVNDINEAPSITFQLAGFDGNGKMNETAAQNFIVANFACANDPEMGGVAAVLE